MELKMMKVRFIATVCILFFSPLNVVASDSQELAPMVVTSTMTEQSIDTVTGTMQLISHDEIEALAAETVSDVLRRAAGINLLTGTGRSQEISIRGLGSGHTLILLDGRRITGGYNATIDVRQIPVLMIDHIEIVRGPGSALYGSEATGGVVNIITTKPPRQTSAGIDARGALGPAAERSVQGMVGSALGPVRANIAAAHYLQDGWDNDIDVAQEIDDTELNTVYTRAAVDLAPGQVLSVGGEWSKFRRNGLRFYQKLNRERNGEDERLGGFLQYEVNPENSSSGLIRVYGNQSEGSYHFSPEAGSSSKKRQLLQVEARESFHLSEALTLTSGGEVRWDTLEGDQMIAGSEDGESDRDTALFGQADWSPVEWFNIVGSLRYDDYKNSGSHVTPRLVASIFIPQGRFWASYGEGFRAASLDEMYGQVSKRQGKDIYYGNENLAPETSESFEIGAEAHNERIHGQLVYFYNQLEDLIEAKILGTAGGISSYQYENVEKAETYGIEVEAGINVARSIELSGQATWLQTENKETGDELANEPEWKGELTVSWQIPWITTEAQLRYLYFGDCEDGSGVERDGYDLVGLNLSKKITEQLRIYAGADNLFKEENNYFYQDPLQVYAGVNYHF